METLEERASKRKEELWTDFKVCFEQLINWKQHSLEYLKDFETDNPSKKFERLLHDNVNNNRLPGKRFKTVGFELVFDWFLSEVGDLKGINSLKRSESRPDRMSIEQRIRSIKFINFISKSNRQMNEKTRPLHKLKMIIELWGDFQIVCQRICDMKHLLPENRINILKYFDQVFLSELDKIIVSVILTDEEKKIIQSSGLKERYYHWDAEKEDIEETILTYEQPKGLSKSVWSRIKQLYRLNKDPFTRHNPNR